MKTYQLLLVEDNEGDVLLTSEALEEADFPFEIKIARTGKEAIDLLQDLSKEDLPDLVILDINLPVKNGFEVLREIRGNPITVDLPVMILSTSSNMEDKRKANKYDPKIFCSKPTEFSEFEVLVQTIKSILQEGK